MTQLEIHRLFPKRMNDRTLQLMSMHHWPFIALGLVLGCEPQATLLARSNLAAYRKGYFTGVKHYPIYVFILRVLSDFIENASIEFSGEALEEPVLLVLFDLWKCPDPEQIAEACLTALDYHTHRCKHGDIKNRYEFERGNWTRIPIEIWLIFKLRAQLGLANPVLDHPMMEGSCGILPKDCEFKPGELLVAVYERMKQDGFDEEKISTELINS